MTVGKNDLHENELFSLINIVTAIKTGIKNPNKTATNAFLMRNAKQKMSLKNVFHMCQFYFFRVTIESIVRTTAILHKLQGEWTAKYTKTH